PFQVFTAFWRHCLSELNPEEPLAAPRHLTAPAAWPQSLDLVSLELLPRINWDVGIASAWKPGETEAIRRLREFCANAVNEYLVARDRPGQPGTSRLSPHLHFGELSPRQIWYRLRRSAEE